MTKRKRICKDCKAPQGGATARPAPHPGPRCATHHRQVRKTRSQAASVAHVQNTYRITDQQYQALLDAQGGVCAVCQRARGVTRRLSVDHDHKCCPGPTSCGRCVRGLLCRHCNRDIIGFLRDDPAAFDRAAAYLRRPPAFDVIASYRRVLEAGQREAGEVA